MKRPALTDDLRALVRAEYQRLAADGVARKSVDHIEQAFAVLAKELRPDRKKCYPCFHPWLDAAAPKLPTTPVADQPSPAPRKARGVISARKTAAAVSLTSAPNPFKDAIQLLVAVIVSEVRRELAPQLEAALARPVVEAALKLAPAETDAKNPDTWDDAQLVREIAAAKTANNLIRWHRLVGIRRKRELAANSFAAPPDSGLRTQDYSQ